MEEEVILVEENLREPTDTREPIDDTARDGDQVVVSSWGEAE